MMRKLILTLAFSTLFATFPLRAGEAANSSPSRRDAARLAAKKAEEETNKSLMPGQPSQSGKPEVVPEAVEGADSAVLDAEMAPGVRAVMHGAGDLAGKRYILQEVDGEEIEAGTPVFVEWRSETEMGGRVCNTFRAKCSFLNTVVKAEEILSTRMACTDEDMGKLENRLFAALRVGMAFVAAGDMLEMRRDDLVLRFMLDTGEGKPDGKADAKADAKEKEEEPAPVASVVGEEDLIGKRFVLDKVDGEEFSTSMGRQPSIEFGEELRVGGSACNTFVGPGSLEDGKLIVANAASTMMMCVDPKLAAFEGYFHQMLRDGVEVALDGDVLTLTGGGRTLEYVEEK